MKIGDLVKLRFEEIYGVVKYSSFGFSIHSWHTGSEIEGISKTLGAPANELLKYWDIIDELPTDYELNKFGVPVKKKNPKGVGLKMKEIRRESELESTLRIAKSEAILDTAFGLIQEVLDDDSIDLEQAYSEIKKIMSEVERQIEV